MLSSRDTSHHQMVKGIKTANHEHLVVTRKITVEGDRLQIDVPSTRSGMDPNARPEVLPGRCGSNSFALQPAILHGCRSKAAIMAPSSTPVRIARGRPVFISVVCVTLLFS